MINTLKDLETINGKAIMHIMGGNDHPKGSHIEVNHIDDTIKLNMLTKPASEGGDLNKCQWSDLVTVGLEQLKHLNNKFPCKENAIAITHIETALLWNDKRTSDRIKRNVEGKNLK